MVWNLAVRQAPEVQTLQWNLSHQEHHGLQAVPLLREVQGHQVAQCRQVVLGHQTLQADLSDQGFPCLRRDLAGRQVQELQSHLE